MNVASVSSLNLVDPVQAKALKAGAQFEAILMDMAFGDLQKSFSRLPGATEDAVGKSYTGFGMEALTSALSRDGGIGIGAVITKALLAQRKPTTNGI